jgi:hypothetical protein
MRYASGGPYAAACTPRQLPVLVRISGSSADAELHDVPFTDLAALRSSAFLDLVVGKESVVSRVRRRVIMLRSVAGRRPTAEDEADVVEMEGIATAGELMAQAGSSSTAYYFRVRTTAAVQKPDSSGAAVNVAVTMPALRRVLTAGTSSTTAAHADGGRVLPEGLDVPTAVWAGMGPDAQTAVIDSAAQRRFVRSVGAFKALDVPLTVAAAEAVGIRVLCKDVDGNVEAGSFDLQQQLDHRPAPTTENATWVLALPQRVELASEFVRAVRNRTKDFGTLVSGPNGVGKSGVGLLAYLLCLHHGLLVAYIPRGKAWVHAAQRGRGDAYLMKMFWMQNADIIAASEPLRGVFHAVMTGRDDPFGDAGRMMEALQDVVAAAGGPCAGVIIDEAQKITGEEGQACNVHAPTAASW